MAFAGLNAHPRSIGARTNTDTFNALAETCDVFSTDEWWNHFEADG